MSPPFIALFKKEWRQHGNSALGTIAGSLAICAAIFALGIYIGESAEPGFYFAIAVYIALIYTWVMSATVYVAEHDKNTFPFLRNLPVSPLTIALGKVGWALFASGLVLAANLLGSTVCCLLQGEFPLRHATVLDVTEMLLFVGLVFIELFVWGIFWSTRCRNAAFAVFAAAACALLTHAGIAWFLHYFAPSFFSDNFLRPFMFFHLQVILIVGVFAVWGTLRWFDFSVKDTRKVWIPRNFVFARYPQRVQPPFLALIHQHLRHASLVYPLGVLCFFLFSLGCLLSCYILSYSIQFDHLWIIPAGFIVVMGIIIFWGNIFGHDQRKDSYKFLGRIGVPPGKVWWSRMLPAVLLYIPVLFCFLAFLSVEADLRKEFLVAAQIAFTVWLTLLAAGAFCSISCEKQMMGIGHTMILCFFLSHAWQTFFLLSFGSSPLWTTVPVALAFLVASRLRAGYWLREITTWRSRLIPLLPVFGTILAVFIALPFVRVYSVPLVSWTQIESYLAGTPAPYQDRLMQHYTNEKDYTRSVFSGAILEGMNSDDPDYAAYFCLRFMPWEEARRERILRLEIVAALVNSGVIRDNRALSIGWYHPRLKRNQQIPYGGMWDKVWGNTLLNLERQTVAE